jgi:hypothetical protein
MRRNLPLPFLGAMPTLGDPWESFKSMAPLLGLSEMLVDDTPAATSIATPTIDITPIYTKKI